MSRRYVGELPRFQLAEGGLDRLDEARPIVGRDPFLGEPHPGGCQSRADGIHQLACSASEEVVAQLIELGIPGPRPHLPKRGQQRGPGSIDRKSGRLQLEQLGPPVRLDPVLPSFPIQNAVPKSERASCPSASATFRFA